MINKVGIRAAVVCLFLLVSCAASLEKQEAAISAVPEASIQTTIVSAAKAGPTIRLLPDRDLDTSISEDDGLVLVDGKRVPYKVVEFVAPKGGKWKFHLISKSRMDGLGSGAVVVPTVVVFDDSFDELKGRLTRDAVGGDGVFGAYGYQMEFFLELPRPGSYRLVVFPDSAVIDVSVHELPAGAIRGHYFGPISLRAKLSSR